MTQLPSVGYPSDAARTQGEIKSYLEDTLARMKQMPGGSALAALTISAGGITPSTPFFGVAPESGAADDLDTISQANLEDGALVMLRGTDGNVITVKDSAGGVGEIITRRGDAVLRSSKDWIELIRVGTKWLERERSLYHRGARVFTTAATNLTSITNAVSWNTEEFDSDGFWTISGSTAIVIASTGINKIRLFGSIQSSAGTVNGIYAQFKKFAPATVYGAGSAAATPQGAYLFIQSEPISVSFSDIFTLEARHTGSSGTLAIDVGANASYFGVEVLE